MFLSGKQGDGNGIGAKPQNVLAPPLAPSGEVGTWTKGTDMPTARCGLSNAVVNGKIYVIGGGSGKEFQRGAPTRIEEYDPETDTWTKKASNTE